MQVQTLRTGNGAQCSTVPSAINLETHLDKESPVGPSVTVPSVHGRKCSKVLTTATAGSLTWEETPAFVRATQPKTSPIKSHAKIDSPSDTFISLCVDVPDGVCPTVVCVKAGVV